MYVKCLLCITYSMYICFLQAHWNIRRERWSLEKEGSCSLFMMSTRKLEGEPACSQSA